MEKLQYFVKTKYKLQKRYHKYCATLGALFIVLLVCAFYLKFCCIFLESFPHMQVQLKILSLDIVFALEYNVMQQVQKARTGFDLRTLIHKSIKVAIKFFGI